MRPHPDGARVHVVVFRFADGLRSSGPINIVFVGGLLAYVLAGARGVESALAGSPCTRVHEPRGRPRLPVKRHVAARAAPPVLGTTENLTASNGENPARAPGLEALRPNPLPSCGLIWVSGHVKARVF